jgi:hypothetical protein
MRIVDPFITTPRTKLNVSAVAKFLFFRSCKSMIGSS